MFFPTDLAPSIKRVPNPLKDSILIQSEMIRHGLHTARLPKNALFVPDGAPHSLAFIGAESFDTSFAAHSVTSDIRSSRAFMGRDRIPVPRSRTFRKSHLKSIARFADSIGYPVAIQEPRREYRATAGVVVDSSAGIAPAIQRLARAGDPKFVFVERVEGSIVLDVLVMGHEVLSVLEEFRPSRDSNPKEVRTSVPPELLRLAVDALSSLPGLGHGSVLLAVDSLTADPGKAQVLGVNAASRLWDRVEAEPSNELPARVLYWHAKRAGITLSPRKEPTEVAMNFEGIIDRSGFFGAVSELSVDLLEIAAWPEVRATRSATASIGATGPALAIAFLSAQAIRGLAPRQRAYLVETKPVDW